jgi:putative membrane protein
MIRTGKDFSEAVERAVRDAERGTAAELIVVVARRSGSYLDVALAVGAAAAMVALLVALFAPKVFLPAAVAVEVPVVFGLVAWLAHRTPRLLLALCPAWRVKRHVERAAASHFLDEAVHGMKARTGLLVYVSLLEETVLLLPDLGLEGRLPSAAWSEIRWSATGEPSRPRTQDDVVRGIAAIGAILKERVPSDVGDVNESPDAPRMIH